MKNSSKRRDKRRLAGAVAVLIVLAMVLSLIVPVFAAPYAAVTTDSTYSYYELSGAENEEEEETVIDDDDSEKLSQTLEVQVEAGFDGIYKMEEQTPVHVTVYNNGEDFKGTVQVKMYKNPVSDVYVTYEKSADIPAGGAGEYDFIIYPDTDFTYINVKILDESGNTASSVNAETTSLSAEQMITAVVTDTRSNGLDYLNNLAVAEDIYNRSGYTTNYVTFLDRDSLPENSAVMSSFGVVIIDDFNSASLSDEQKKALSSWVENGGLLVIGTGLNAEKTLKGLDIFEYTIKGSDTTLCFGGTADTAVIDIPGSEALDIQNGNEITKSVDMGEGKIIVHSFDLGADPIASMTTAAEYLSELYRNTMPEKFGVDREIYYDYTSLYPVNRLPSIEKSNLMKLLAVLLIYAVTVGPICYLILKKKDRREKGWIAIPIISVAFSGIIFGISSVSYHKDSLISFMTYTDLDYDYADTEIGVGIRTPEKGTVSFSVDDEIVMSGNNTYYGTPTSPGNNLLYTIKEEDAKTEIVYYNQNSWENNYFLTTAESVCESDSIAADLRVEGSAIVGTVTNNMENDLVDVLATFAGQTIRIGYIPAGESAEINIPLSSEEYTKWVDNSYQMLRQLFYGLSDNDYNDSLVFRTGMSTTEAYKIEQRYRLFTDTQNYSGGDLRNTDFKVKISAYSENPIITGEKTINGEAVNENWENLYTKTFDVEMSDNFDIPAGYIFADRVYLDDILQQNNIDIYYYELYTGSANSVGCEYDLPGADKITSMEFSWDNYDAFVSEPQIYRYSDDTWVNISAADLKNGAQDYISEEGKLNVKAEIYNDTYVTLPKISIKGGK